MGASEPEPGVWNDEAFAHYRDVLQAMHDAGLAPMVTLVHNTWPLHVQAAGKGAGLLDRGFPDRVARFAEEVARRLGDLIGDYVTLNEPDSSSTAGSRAFGCARTRCRPVSRHMHPAMRRWTTC